MDVLTDIRQKLLSGKRPKELVKDGYAKSSVYYAARKLRNDYSGTPELPIDEELTELRRRKEITKLEKEIAELQASKEQLPERVARLEKQFTFLYELVRSVGDTLCYLDFLQFASTDEAKAEAKEEGDGWVERVIEPQVKSRLSI